MTEPAPGAGPPVLLGGMAHPRVTWHRAAWARLLLVCLVGTALRLPSFRYTVISDDEAIYDAMAHAVTAGGVMYRDTVDHKPPGLTYTYALAQAIAPGWSASMAVVHLFGILAVLGTALGLWVLARRWLRPGLALWAPLLYLVVSAAKRPVDGLAVNGELLMNLPAVWAVCLGVLAGDERWRGGWGSLGRVGLDLGAGLLVGAAALYKYQAGLVGLALIGLGTAELAAVGPTATRRTLRFLTRGATWLTGFLLAFGLVVAWLWHRGVLADALRWGVGFNRDYLDEGPGLTWALQRFGLQLVCVVLPGALLYVGGLVTLARLALSGMARPRDVVCGRLALILWALSAFLAVGLGERFFGHYFLQAELPLALLAAGPVARLFQRAPRRAAVALGLPAAAFALLAASPARDLLDPGVPDWQRIGRAIAARTAPTDTIWVWGNLPQLYHGAERVQGVRFSFCNYLTGLSPATPSEYDPALDPRDDIVHPAWRMVLDDLDRRRPALVIDTAAAGLKSYGKFPIADYHKLARYLAAHYRPDGDAAGVPVYRRAD